MAALKTPRFIAFDSSHLGAWARDWSASDATQRARSQAFETLLSETGWVPLICWHHLEELLNHSEAVVEARVDFLCSFPVVGWVAHRGGEGLPGGIVDLVGAELRAVLAEPNRTANEVRRAARGSILRVGSGREAFGGFRAIWRDLLPHLRDHAENARRNVAITRAAFNDTDKVRVIDLLRGRFRDPAGQSEAIATMTARLVPYRTPRRSPTSYETTVSTGDAGMLSAPRSRTSIAGHTGLACLAQRGQQARQRRAPSARPAACRGIRPGRIAVRAAAGRRSSAAPGRRARPAGRRARP